MITREYLPYLQREYIIWGLFVITFVWPFSLYDV